MKAYRFLDKKGTFELENPQHTNYLYFPLAGEQGIKSAVTPSLGGDSKIDQNTFLLEPVSVENLHNNKSSRNFWCKIKDKGCWSATGVSAQEENNRFTDREEKVTLQAGFMWQSVTRESGTYEMKSTITSFVPLAHNVELMHVSLMNIGDSDQTITPIAAIPIYARSADNIRDHRHVTSLLNRITTTQNAVIVKPTLSFDERGHRENENYYFVCGMSGTGDQPESFYPEVEGFLGEGGSFLHPLAVYGEVKPVGAGAYLEGKEAMGGILFPQISLAAGACVSYTIILGMEAQEEKIAHAAEAYNTEQKVLAALEEVKQYWQDKVNVDYHTGSEEFDQFMHWVSFQPILRRIFGCSFLPHHDYGKGGRGWRDLWQDCLALLIMNPDGVRQMIMDNFGGVRMDGTNATIIGTKQGEFIADRNNISRVWMDHGVWPYMTTQFYIDQTGDFDILDEMATYFKDMQVERGTSRDNKWDVKYGNRQKTVTGKLYEGSILEHLLLQNLTAFYEVGEHNQMCLRGADWNDAIDMASERGESVAFTCAYAGNLYKLADCIKRYAKHKQTEEILLLSEMKVLLENNAETYDSIEMKQGILNDYLRLCRHNISGKKIPVHVACVIESLRDKADWLMSHIRAQEWVQDKDGNGWFNGYYDNHGNQVEGQFDGHVRMMLTSQVFAIMSGTATDGQIHEITKSADKHLYQKEAGGYRLNTDFGEVKTDLGRMFGFGYGEKENGAVFSHMTVMYANALYQRGYVKEGYQALQTLADTALNFEVSRIYPGIPEYFNADGRGRYHYLTGAASWYMLTVITEVFGVRGEYGTLCIQPKLMPQQFNDKGEASISLYYMGKRIEVCYQNPNRLMPWEYQISGVNEEIRDHCTIMDNKVCIDQRYVIDNNKEETLYIKVTLE